MLKCTTCELCTEGIVPNYSHFISKRLTPVKTLVLRSETALNLSASTSCVPLASQQSRLRIQFLFRSAVVCTRGEAHKVYLLLLLLVFVFLRCRSHVAQAGLKLLRESRVNVNFDLHSSPSWVLGLQVWITKSGLDSGGDQIQGLIHAKQALCKLN